MTVTRGPVDLQQMAKGRHQAVQSAVRWLVPNPRLAGKPAAVAHAFTGLAAHLLEVIPDDDPQLTRALDTLTQAKDYAVRAAIAGSDGAP